MVSAKLFKIPEFTGTLKVVILTDSSDENNPIVKKVNRFVSRFLDESGVSFELVCKATSDANYFNVRDAVYAAHIIILCEVEATSSSMEFVLNSREARGVTFPKKIIFISREMFGDVWDKLYYRGIDFISVSDYQEEMFERILLTTVLSVLLQSGNDGDLKLNE